MWELAIYDDGMLCTDAFDYSEQPEVGAVITDDLGIEMEIINVTIIDHECQMASVEIIYR
ncbi:MAG: hypothetical protein F6K14_11735 [Symploca sp. SIO2C1]|nr:hypothetical protein [Symploca sp. SIO2C1]